MYALVDCNNFYVSCERVFNPSLNGKPVVVLSNNDGCIISRSNEAKDLGIKMGEPFFKAKPLIDRHGVRVFSSNYTLYADMSARVMRILSECTPDFEVYSIDEAFLGLEGFPRERLQRYAEVVREKVLRCTGIPVSIGVGPNKTLAKVANRLSKSGGYPNGACVLDTPEQIVEVLKTYPAAEVWGIGRRISRALAEQGIYTAYEYMQAPAEYIRKRFTITGLRIREELRGFPCAEIGRGAADKKSMISSRSFEKVLHRFEAVEEAVAFHATSLAQKLRKQRSKASCIGVFIYTDRFKDTRPYFGHTSLVLEEPSYSTSTLVRAALQGLKKIYREGLGYKKAGVFAAGMVPAGIFQRDLFTAPEQQAKAERLSFLTDGINRKFGKLTLRPAKVGFGSDWYMRAALKSPCYTTNLNEVITVRI